MSADYDEQRRLAEQKRVEESIARKARLCVVEQCTNALQNAQIAHPKFNEARERLYSQIALAPPGRVIFFVGATRAGKNKIIRWLLKEFNLTLDDKYEPVLFVEASSKVNARGAVKHVLRQLLMAVRHPVYGQSLWTKDPGRSPTESDLTLAFEEAMELRKVIHVYIDEAHHLVATTNQELRITNADALKGLVSPGADVTKAGAPRKRAVLIAIGSYDLLRNGFQSSHFNGRLQVVHLERYSTSSKDQEDFSKTLARVDKLLPLSEGFSLAASCTFIYTTTFGVFGQVIEWCLCALAEMAACGCTELVIAHFETTRLMIQLPETLADIQDGELLARKLSSNISQTDIEQLFAKLHRPKSGTSPSPAKKGPVGKKKPFQKKPKR